MRAYVCAQCGKAFEAHAKKEGVRYCSRRCYGDAKILPALDSRMCQQCGATFVPKRHAFTTAAYQGAFCSVACANTARAVPMMDRYKQYLALAERTETGCLLWPSTQDKSGYGVISGDDGKQLRVHRLTYELHHGPLNADILVRHSCDNPPCFEPTHLIAGTSGDNNRDMVERGRDKHPGPTNPPRGEAHHNTHLTADIVRALRARCAAGESQAALAREYGVHQTAVSSVVRYRTWKHVE